MLNVFLCPPLYYRFFLIVLMAVSILSQKGPKQTPSEDTKKKKFSTETLRVNYPFSSKNLVAGTKK